MRSSREDSFERLYAEHAQDLFAFLRYRTGSGELAEELLAETCERALRARRRFDPRRGSAKTWLYAIALNCLHDHMRRRASESRALERVAAGATPAATDDLEELIEGEQGPAQRDRLSRGLDTLSEEEREAVSLRFGAELSVGEIAGLTGERITAVQRRIHRSLRKLRETLEP